MAETAEQFIEALRKLESARETEPIVALFAEACRIGNVASTHEFEGADGARAFWENYRNTFDEVSSEFHNKIVSERAAALEWTTEGTNAAGEPIKYSGVSILETENGRIKRFFAYFDPHRLGNQIKKEAQSGG